MIASFKIAVRFLKSSRGQTVMIAIGIAIGIAVQIFIGSLIQGLQKSLIDSTIGNAAHITIQQEDNDQLMADYESVIDAVRAADERITYISPVLQQAALIIDGDQTESILIRGFDYKRANPIYAFDSRFVEGRLPAGANEAAIGKELQAELSLSVGDPVDITITGGTKLTYTVSGVFDLKVQSLNKSWFLTTLESAQDQLDKSGLISTIEMQVDDDSVFQVDELAVQLAELPDFSEKKLIQWKEQNEQLLSGLNGQSISSLMIQVFVIVSVVLAIASILAISVLQKSKQIGILKAMGIRNRQASLIFLFQGLILGILGGFLGVALGLGLAYAFTVFARNPDGTPVVALLIEPGFFALSFLIAVVASSLASLIPARRSSRLDPIEVIRNG
ncbi:MAG: ABC transporter permease [Clostridiaceae bacterium]|jgi:lipoprotein-releasing system permease protein|nr:ABC transporter permease [Clostridiaceae bacterium]